MIRPPLPPEKLDKEFKILDKLNQRLERINKIQRKREVKKDILKIKEKVEEDLKKNQEIKQIIEERLLEIEKIYNKLHKFLDYEKEMPKESLVNLMSEIDLDNKHLKRRTEDIENEISIILKDKKYYDSNQDRLSRQLSSIQDSLNDLKLRITTQEKISGESKKTANLVNEIAQEVIELNKKPLTKDNEEDIIYLKEKLLEIERIDKKLNLVNEKASEIENIHNYLDEINERTLKIGALEDNQRRLNDKIMALTKNKEEFNNLGEFYYKFRDISKVWDHIKNLNNRIENKDSLDKNNFFKKPSEVNSKLKEDIRKSQIKLLVNRLIHNGNTRLEITNVLESQGYSQWEIKEALS